jgi:hypothetical protein
MWLFPHLIEEEYEDMFGSKQFSCVDIVEGQEDELTLLVVTALTKLE